ncbi:hypothetical protein MPL1_10888 [Methylophaga lonarensis MPL]|uniref:Uncharacterized protein n=1 Tax=Methylophaga lonarensis MPL TaxID=1286106 RepID=M7NYM5_9GAMM|nr:DUF6231 family protein [Methylophaga lonarensis]EMR12332.1 hypothetical protein MPL1_10888 [Methylophaga lonarensis MPL]
MTDSIALSKILVPLVARFQPKSLLLAGETALECIKGYEDTRLLKITTPFAQSQLEQLPLVDVAVISDLTEQLDVAAGQQWLGSLRNRYTPHIFLISEPAQARQNGWQLTDYLALGLRHIAGTQQGVQLFSYAIENYQYRRDWLNSRFWANPENYDKYRW